MIILPKSSLKAGTCVLVSDKARNIYYTVDNVYTHKVQLPKYERPKTTEEIMFESEKFVNGYKVVVMENGEYAYVSEDYNQLLPFRYDIAGNFNEYGYAMVGKNGNVSWINKEFNYLSENGEFIFENIYDLKDKFPGWMSVSEFSSGSIPLSKVYEGRCDSGKIFYMGIDGKFKKFFECDGTIVSNCGYQKFVEGSEFDEKGYAFAKINYERVILLAKGYILSLDGIFKLAITDGLFDKYTVTDDFDSSVQEKRISLKISQQL